jgi:hypothetical protein
MDRCSNKENIAIPSETNLLWVFILYVCIRFHTITTKTIFNVGTNIFTEDGQTFLSGNNPYCTTSGSALRNGSQSIPLYLIASTITSSPLPKIKSVACGKAHVLFVTGNYYIHISSSHFFKRRRRCVFDGMEQ